MRLLFTCFTLSAAVITPGADKLVDDALDGCDALLVKQLRTERDSRLQGARRRRRGEGRRRGDRAAPRR